MESKTIRVHRQVVATDEGRFDDVEGRITVYVTNAYDGFNELDITVTPIASREERLREAREKALLNASYDEKLLPRRIVEIIEGVDAEFAMVET